MKIIERILLTIVATILPVLVWHITAPSDLCWMDGHQLGMSVVGLVVFSLLLVASLAIMEEQKENQNNE